MKPKLFLQDIASVNDCTLQYIHKMIKESDIKTKKHNNKIYVDNESAKKLIKPKIEKQVVSIHTTKGGVGKTTITTNLAIRLWLYGAKVLVIDLDSQGNLSKTFGFNKPNQKILQDVLETKCEFKDTIKTFEKGLDIVPSNLRNATNAQFMQAYMVESKNFLPKYIKSIRDNYDIVLIDCPPALGSNIVSAMMASDKVISVCDPDEYAMDGVSQSQDQVKIINEDRDTPIEFKILLNKHDSRTLVSTKTLAHLFTSAAFKNATFETVIGSSAEFNNTKLDNSSLWDTYKKKNKAGRAIDELCRELLGWKMPQKEE